MKILPSLYSVQDSEDIPKIDFVEKEKIKSKFPAHASKWLVKSFHP